MAANNAAALKKLGYDVVESAKAPKAADGTDKDGFWTYYAVEGFGIEMVLREDDDAWASLLDADLHAERVRQDGETETETLERLAAEERERLVAEGKPLGALGVDDSATPIP
jgi:hypothetical protein